MYVSARKIQILKHMPEIFPPGGIENGTKGMIWIGLHHLKPLDKTEFFFIN